MRAWPSRCSRCGLEAGPDYFKDESDGRIYCVPCMREIDPRGAAEILDLVRSYEEQKRERELRPEDRRPDGC